MGVACVSSSDIEGLHRQMGDIQKQIQTLEKKSSSKEEVEKLNQNVATQTTQLLKSNADTAVRLGELTTKMEQLEAKLEDTNRRLSQLSQQIAETQGDLMRLRDAGAGTALPRGSAGDTRRRSGRAVLRRRGRRPPSSTTPLTPTTRRADTLSRSRASRTTWRAYPTTDLSDNAQYWIGESHFAQKKFAEAIVDFTELLKRWPASDKAAAALLKKAYALVETGQKAEAVIQLQYVIHEFPTSDEARLAKSRLKSMGIEAKG